MSFFDGPQEPPQLLRDIQGFIWHAYDYNPRTLQKALGPSEIGHGCDRRTAYELALEKGSVELRAWIPDPWPSILGTAAHAWFSDAVKLANKHLGRERWISERRVTAWDDVEGGSGSADLYDTDTGTVVDLKNLGKKSMEKHVRKGPEPQYVVQIHTYGLGYQNAGYDVRNVAILAVPRSGRLADADLWIRPYNPAVAQAAHERMQLLTQTVKALNVAEHHERFNLFTTNPGAACRYCRHRVKNADPAQPLQCNGSTQEEDE